MDIITTINLLLKVTDTIASKLPDEEQRRRNDYIKIKREYLYESAQAYPERDDNLIDTLRDQLFTSIQGISEALPEKNV